MTGVSLRNVPFGAGPRASATTASGTPRAPSAVAWPSVSENAPAAMSALARGPPSGARGPAIACDRAADCAAVRSRTTASLPHCEFMPAPRRTACPNVTPPHLPWKGASASAPASGTGAAPGAVMLTSDGSARDASIVSLNRRVAVPADMSSTWAAGGPATPGLVKALTKANVAVLVLAIRLPERSVTAPSPRVRVSPRSLFLAIWSCWAGTSSTVKAGPSSVVTTRAPSRGMLVRAHHESDISLACTSDTSTYSCSLTVIRPPARSTTGAPSRWGRPRSACTPTSSSRAAATGLPARSATAPAPMSRRSPPERACAPIASASWPGVRVRTRAVLSAVEAAAPARPVRPSPPAPSTWKSDALADDASTVSENTTVSLRLAASRLGRAPAAGAGGSPSGATDSRRPDPPGYGLPCSAPRNAPSPTSRSSRPGAAAAAARTAASLWALVRETAIPASPPSATAAPPSGMDQAAPSPSASADGSALPTSTAESNDSESVPDERSREPASPPAPRRSRGGTPSGSIASPAVASRTRLPDGSATAPAPTCIWRRAAPPPGGLL